MRRREALLRAIIRSLAFQRDNGKALSGVNADEWPLLLEIADEARLALPLAIRHAGNLPGGVRRSLEIRQLNNARRLERTIETLEEVNGALARRDIPFVFLKGVSHFPYFCAHPSHRQQYDADVYCPQSHVRAAVAALRDIGYRPLQRGNLPRTDHLPTMVRTTGWRWRGDYYDPDMPLHLELHFRFWDAETEFFDVAGADRFWANRVVRRIACASIPALDLRDTVRYAAWHLVRHVLRGSLAPSHLYELARVFHITAGDDSFWNDWDATRADVLLAEAIAARLAADCFECDLNRRVRALADTLPAPVRRWFDLFALSPLISRTRPNRDELLLHLMIAKGAANRCRIAVRRLFPPWPLLLADDPDETSAARKFLRNAQHLGSRGFRHLRAIVPLASSGLRLLRGAAR